MTTQILARRTRAKSRCVGLLAAVLASVGCRHHQADKVSVVAAHASPDGKFAIVAISSDANANIDLVRVASDGAWTWTTQTACMRGGSLAVIADVAVVRCGVETMTTRVSAFSTSSGAELWHRDVADDELDLDGGAAVVVDDAVVAYGKSGLKIVALKDGTVRAERPGELDFSSLFVVGGNVALSSEKSLLYANVHSGKVEQDQNSGTEGCVIGNGRFDRRRQAIVRRDLSNLGGPETTILDVVPADSERLRACGEYKGDDVFELGGARGPHILRVGPSGKLVSDVLIENEKLDEERWTSKRDGVDLNGSLPHYPQVVLDGPSPKLATLDLEAGTVAAKGNRKKSENAFRIGDYWFSQSLTGIALYDGSSNRQSPVVTLHSTHGVATQFGAAMVGGDRIWLIGTGTFDRGKVDVAVLDMNLSFVSGLGIRIAK